MVRNVYTEITYTQTVVRGERLEEKQNGDGMFASPDFGRRVQADQLFVSHIQNRDTLFLVNTVWSRYAKYETRPSQIKMFLVLFSAKLLFFSFFFFQDFVLHCKQANLQISLTTSTCSEHCQFINRQYRLASRPTNNMN